MTTRTGSLLVDPDASKITESWTAPPGWIEARAGIFTPPHYEASRWEVQHVAGIRSRDDAVLDYAKCAKSFGYFAFMHVWTVDVDDPMGSSIRKVPAFPHLRRFAKEIQAPANVHIEKSRQMLMSWIQMALFLWDILFHDNWPDLVISKRAKDVDDGGSNSTVDSNLGKVRFMYEHLPRHVWQPFEIKSFKIRNVIRESHITGETGTGGNASRGPTYRRGLMDEAAYIERSESVFKGVRQAAKTGTMLQSTPNGKGNAFARIKFQANTTFKKLTFHWSEHPRKSVGGYCACGRWKADPQSNLLPHEQYSAHRKSCPLPVPQQRMRSPWYDASCRDMRDEDVASELDISYERSQRGRVYDPFDASIHTFDHALFIDKRTGKPIGERRLHESDDAYRLRYLRGVLDPTLPIVVGWDFGVSDNAAMLLGQVTDVDLMSIRFVDALVDNNKSYKHYGQFFLDFWLRAWQDVGGPAFYSFAHYGDPSGKNRDSSLESWLSNLGNEPYNIKIKRSPVIKPASKLDWLDFIRDQYRDDCIIISTFATVIIDAVEQYHFPLDENGNPIPGKQEPEHDEWSHPMDGKRYIYQGRWPNRLRVRSIEAASRQRNVMSNTGRGSAVDFKEF